MVTQHTEQRIGEAWRLHRNHDYQGAIRMYEDILKSAPNHVDVLYGLGLAQKSLGNTSDAIKSFHRSLDIARGALRGVRTAASADGVVGANDIESAEDDRYMMLVRMIKQRLAELGVDMDMRTTLEVPTIR